MVILGMWDGPGSGVALVAGDRLAAVAHERASARGLPWDLADDLLGRCGISRKDVELLALAGRFTPPFALRKRPNLRALVDDPFALARSAGARWQSLLRRTGLGAADADRVSEWFVTRARERGYSPLRTATVDIHKALAAAAYRCQPDPDALVIIGQPHGDGALLTVHDGQSGQLDRIAIERGRASAHLWQERCRAAAEIPSDDLLYAWARLEPPAVDLGLRLTERGFDVIAPSGASPDRGPWQALRGADKGQAASAIASTLREGLLQWISARWHRWPRRETLAIGGLWASDPHLVAALASLPGVLRVCAGPWLGPEALAVGAALWMSGAAPMLPGGDLCRRPRPELTPQPSPRDPSALAERIAAGEGIGWLADSEPRAFALVRADRPDAVERLRAGLGRPTFGTPPLWGLPDALPVLGLGALAHPLRYGLAAPALAGDLDRRAIRHAHERDLVSLLSALEGRGVRALAALPLAFGAERGVQRAEDAVAIAARAGLVAVDLGSAGVVWTRSSP